MCVWGEEVCVCVWGGDKCGQAVQWRQVRGGGGKVIKGGGRLCEG